MPTTVEPMNNNVNADIEKSSEVEAKKSSDIENSNKKEKGKGKVDDPIL